MSGSRTEKQKNRLCACHCIAGHVASAGVIENDMNACPGGASVTVTYRPSNTHRDCPLHSNRARTLPITSSCNFIKLVQ